MLPSVAGLRGQLELHGAGRARRRGLVPRRRLCRLRPEQAPPGVLRQAPDAPPAARAEEVGRGSDAGGRDEQQRHPGAADGAPTAQRRPPGGVARDEGPGAAQPAGHGLLILGGEQRRHRRLSNLPRGLIYIYIYIYYICIYLYICLYIYIYVFI